MSGILDRMAKRAVGSLPGIRPLASSSFAQTGARESGFGLETHLEIDRPAEPMRASLPRPAEPISPKRGFLQPPAIRATEPVAPLHERGREPERRVETVSVRPATPESAPPRLGEAERQSNIEPSPFSVPRMTPPGVADEARTERVFAARAAAAPPDAALLPARRGEASPAAVPLSRLAGAREAQSLPPLEQKTEIHISIGSIELRTPPRQDARPIAPPFRPRVTLDDFLRRKSEARS